jgi:tRNA threonylcarbamoyladenosine biosynthesis protein TsaB
MMGEGRLLLMDTCGAAGSVAVAERGAVAGERTLSVRGATAELIPAVRGLMAERGWALDELEAIVVVSGPGSFTGIRIAVSAAKGLSEGAGVPVVALSRLEVLAAKATGGEGRIHAVLDAGRGEFYWGSSVRRGDVLTCEREAMLRREELERELAASAGRLVVCEAKVAEALEGLRPERVEEPVASDALGPALAALRAGRLADVATLDANYLRRAEVEMLEKMKAHAHEAGA